MIFDVYLPELPDDVDHELGHWAKKNCPSFITYSTTDTSDTPSCYDTISVFEFSSLEDATLFKLTWL